MKKFNTTSVTALALSYFLPVALFAQASGGGNSVTITNPIGASGGNDILGVLTLLLQNVVMPIAAVLIVLYIIYAGFTFVTAQGKPAEIAKAQQRLLWALIGAGILLGAAGIAQVVKTTVSSLTS